MKRNLFLMEVKWYIKEQEIPKQIIYVSDVSIPEDEITGRFASNWKKILLFTNGTENKLQSKA